MHTLAVVSILLFTTLAHGGQISVTGKCETKVVPDRGSLQLQTEKTAPTVKEALADVTRKIDEARASVQKLKLADLELKTTQFQVNPHHEWQNNKNVFKGYRASLGLDITTSDITKLGEVMSSAAKIGLTGTGNLRTYLSLEKSRSEYLACLDVAAEDAQKKAQRLAQKLGHKIDEVLSVEEGSYQSNPQQPVLFEAAMAKSSDAAPTIDVGTEVLSTSIRVTFKLK